MTRQYAYLFGGSRDVDSTPLSNILSSIQLDGSLHYTTFTIVEKLKRYFENDLPHYLNCTFVLVIDNIRSHHAKTVKQSLEQPGV